ncbi:MAG: hypothetical protein JJE51_02780 [Thermoanaerobaculia bacterium]|nr:hypothetical protein [Thermoanaerobaculia bacterium]
MRRLHFLLLAALFVAANVSAVAPQFWRIRSADEFLTGEIEGFAVTSRGELRPAPSVRKVATFTDPFVLSQVSSPNGDHFFGTGNEGKIYRLRGTESKAIFTAPEPEIYALAFRDGALFAGTSPNGKVYRVDPESGTSRVFYDPQQAYIWSLRFLANGDLAVATGVDGKLFRVTPAGAGSLFFDAPETHLRSMGQRPDGTLLVGGSGQGRIYAVAMDGSAHALYDSALSEISAIYVDANGTGWAAGVSNVLPSSAPARKDQKTAQQSGAGQSAETKKEEAPTTVEVGFSFEDSNTSATQAGAGELYRINSDDFVEVVRRFEREMIYGLSGGRNGSVLLATGPQGRVYEFSNGEVALIANVPEKQIVSISSAGNTTMVTTTNSGAVYVLNNVPSNRSEFRSAAKDVERFSRFGQYRINGRRLDGGAIAIAFRSGNTSTPDATWSAWSAPSTETAGSIQAPAGRYLQWKLTMPRPAAETAVESVTIAFLNRNIAPSIESLAVLDPAVVLISSAYPSAPQVVEATNPDEYGIFSSLEPARDKTDPGKRMFRKGFRTVSWRARDENGDSLRYSVAFRRKGSDKWLRLRDNIEEPQINFDTSQVPDGLYELKLTVTDAIDNPDMPLSDTRESVEFQVDNTSPSIASSDSGEEIVIRVSDGVSPVGKVEYSADAEKWIRLTPVDGIADSTEETFRLPRSSVQGKFVIVRATDAYFNVATQSVTVR